MPVQDLRSGLGRVASGMVPQTAGCGESRNVASPSHSAETKRAPKQRCRGAQLCREWGERGAGDEVAPSPLAGKLRRTTQHSVEADDRARVARLLTYLGDCRADPAANSQLHTR